MNIKLFLTCGILLLTALLEGVPISEYVIYYENSVPASVKTAAKDLQKYIRKSTGIELKIVHSPVHGMIALGDNPSLRKIGIDPDSFAYEEFIIRTVGKDLFIAGRDLKNDIQTPLRGYSFGTMYGVYEFLERVMGVHWLIPLDERGTYIPDLGKKWDMPELFIQFKPRFTQRSFHCSPVYRTMKYFDFNRHAKAFQAGSALYGCDHYWQYLFPNKDNRQFRFLKDRETTYREHPEYFALRGKRVLPVGDHWSLCLSAPGLEDEMVNRLLAIQRNFNLKTLCISPNDGQPNCECIECQKRLIHLTPELTGELNHRGVMNGKSWTPLVLDNYRQICERLLKEIPDVPVTGFIYQSYEFAPQPKPEKMPKNFVAQMCPCWTAYGPTRLYEGVNRAWHKWQADWNGVFEKQTYYGLDFWLNQTAGMPVSPYPELMQETYDTLNRLNFTGMQMYFNKGFGFSSLGLWMMMQMQWNPNQDANKLMDQFLTCAYGENAAPHVRKIYELSEKSMRDYITFRKGQIGYHFSMGYLKNVCKLCYPEMEKEYLAALSCVRTPEQKWRLELLGANLKLLRFHLERLNLIPMDENSPLFLSDADFPAFSKRRMKGGDLYHYVPDAPVTVHFSGARVSLESVKKTVIPPPQIRKETGSCWFQFHQDIIFRPDRDMTIRLKLEYKTDIDPYTGKPFDADIPYFCVYNVKGELVFTGIAKDYEISFPAKKDEIYYLFYCPSVEYRANPKWRIVSCNANYAFGQRIKAEGLYFWTPAGTSMYFHVPNDVKSFKLHMNGGQHDFAVIGPDGRTLKTAKGRGYDSLAFDDAKPGWWRIDFFGGDYKYLRQSNELSGFWVTAPAKALDIRVKR